MPIVPAPQARQWIDETPNRFARRCLPLLIANQSGWVLLNPLDFWAEWDGNQYKGDIKIYSKHSPPVSSHFGSGILTWHVPYIFRTPPGWNLHVRGVPNLFKDGAVSLEGVVETDWCVMTFTHNWKITRPHHRIHFPAGEPIALLTPVMRGQLEAFNPVIRNLHEDPDLESEFRAWSVSRDEWNKAPSKNWQKHYFQGQTVKGNKAPEHQTRLHLRPFSHINTAPGVSISIHTIENPTSSTSG